MFVTLAVSLWILLLSPAWGQEATVQSGRRTGPIDLKAHFMVHGNVEVEDMLSPPDSSLQGMGVCPCSDGFLLTDDAGRWAWASSDFRFVRRSALEGFPESSPVSLGRSGAVCVPGRGIFASPLVIRKTDGRLTPDFVPRAWIRCGDRQAVDVASVLPVGDRVIDRWGVPWSTHPAYWDAHGVWFSIAGRWYEWDLDENRLDEAEWMNEWLRQTPDSGASRPGREPREAIWKAIRRWTIVRAEGAGPSLYSVEAWEWSGGRWVRTCDLQVPIPVVPTRLEMEAPRLDFLTITGDRSDQVVVVYRVGERRASDGAHMFRYMSFFDVYDLMSCRWVARDQQVSEDAPAISIRMVSRGLWVTSHPRVFRLKVR